jgi:hypothetical protein
MRQVTRRELRYRPPHGGVPSVDGESEMAHLHGSIAAELEQEENTRTAAASGYFPDPESFDGTLAHGPPPTKNRFDDIRAWDVGTWTRERLSFLLTLT